MPSYTWKGRNPRGEAVTGRLDATSEQAVAEELHAGGVTPVSITVEGDGTRAPSGWQILRSRSVNQQDLLVLSRQLHSLQRAGVPLLRALSGLQSAAPTPAQAALLAELRADLDQGRDLSAAMARHPAVFTAFYIAMLQVGELTGRLAEVFLRLSDHIAFELDVKARIKQALRYPAMVVIAMVLAMVAINLFVLPTFATVFAGFKAELPPMTRLLLGVSAFTVAWWPGLLAACGGAVMLVRMQLATAAGRYAWDRLKLRLPVAGPIIFKATIARFARGFALASSSGVPIGQALSVVARTVDNAFVGERIEQMRAGVERGEHLARSAALAGIFPPVVLQMIAVGEETGELDNLLLEVAALYERETDYGIQGLSAAIEPLLLTVMAALVLVLALGVFLPLWNLGQAAMGKPG